MHTRFKLSIALVLTVVGAGCEESRDDAAKAMGAAKPLMESAEQAGEAEERAEHPEGNSEQLVGHAALQATRKAGGPGPITNWRQLRPFLPDDLGDYTADGEVKGTTTNAGSFRITKVERRYEAGERNAQVNISDAFLAPTLKAPFKMAGTVNEEGAEGYKKETQVAGNTAIVEWREDSKRSKALILVGDRFMVNVDVSHAASDEDAVKLASLIDLDELATVVGEAEGAEDEAAAENAE